MSGVRLSCTSFSFPLLPLSDLLRVIQILGIPAVDLCIADGVRDVRTDELLADPEAMADTHRRWCEECELTVDDVFAHVGSGPFDRPVNTADDVLRASNRQRLVGYLRYAAAVGSPGLTISPGGAGDPSMNDSAGAIATRDRSVTEITWLVDQGRSHGVQVSVEPHQGSIAGTVPETEELCRLVPGLTLTLDHSHFIAQGIAQESVHPLFASARHAHIRQARAGRLQCPAPEGILDVPNLLTVAAAHSFRGSFAIEYVHSPLWEMNRLDVLSETIRLRDTMLAMS